MCKARLYGAKSSLQRRGEAPYCKPSCRVLLFCLKRSVVHDHDSTPRGIVGCRQPCDAVEMSVNVEPEMDAILPPSPTSSIFDNAYHRSNIQGVANVHFGMLHGSP
jgi:hypothetical protein